MITNKVLVSPKFRMDNSLLNQIGEHRNQLKIRHDHWVPFLVLSGLSERQRVDDLIRKCTRIQKQPSGYYRLPLNSSFEGWKIPESVIKTTQRLCAHLGNLNNENLDLFWEREEYQFVPEDLKMYWPPFATHHKLKLLRNRYPVVPGFNNKTMLDGNEEGLKKPEITREMFIKQGKRWKIKNKVPEEGQVWRYFSKGGKTYPVMKKGPAAKTVTQSK